MYRRIKNFLFINTSAKQTVAKNTFWLVAGELVGRLFKLAVVVLATRTLGVSGWGLFSYALAFVSFFYILNDFGINTFIVRELSKESAGRDAYLSTSLVLKISLLLALFIISLLVGPHLGKIPLDRSLLTVFSILFFSDCIREFALSVNRSLGKMEREAFAKIVMSSVIATLGIVLLRTHPTPLSLAIAYATGSVIATAIVAWSIKDEFKTIDWKFSSGVLKTIYDFSWPITIISLFSFIFNIDSIMLGQLRSTTDVGLYAAAQRIVQFIAIMPSFVATALFPVLSKNEADTHRLSAMIEKILGVLFVLSIPLAIGGFLLGTELMSIAFGVAYASGGLTLSILMLSLLASFSNTILMNVIFSKNLQKVFIGATSIGVLANILLNIALIPRYGAVGAAIAVTTTQTIIVGINWWKLKKHLSFAVLSKLGTILIAGVLMAAVILTLKMFGSPLIAIVLFASAAYALTLLALKDPFLDETLSLIKR